MWFGHIMGRMIDIVQNILSVAGPSRTGTERGVVAVNGCVSSDCGFLLLIQLAVRTPKSFFLRLYS